MTDNRTRRPHVWGRRFALGLLAVLAIALAAGAWALAPIGPAAEAAPALMPDSQVAVTSGQWLTFTPVANAQPTGFIFYPGARVDPRAYAPAASAIAAQGFTVVIVPMPLNLAFFAPDAAAAVIDAHPEIEQWAVGGHSLGGAMAARFAYTHPGDVAGLVLWAAYPADTDSLAGRGDLAVTSIYGTLDGLATGAKIDASRRLLPPSTIWVPIEGGNHAQFGYYGPQSGDSPATIDAAAQHAQIVTATVALLQSITR